MKRYIKLIGHMALGLFTILAFTACNKDFPNLLQNFNEATDSPDSRDKVLFIMVDGLSGAVVKDLEPENLTLMTRNGLVTYGSLADPTTDFDVTNASVAASILTGVNANKNKVNSSDLSTIAIEKYPTIFSRLKNDENRKLSSFYTSSADYGKYLGKDANVLQANNDETLLALALKGLQNDSTDFNVVHLTNVEKVGTVAGFSLASPAYINAVKSVDKQIQQLVDALKIRKTYSNENWLVIVTSGKGGETKEPTTDYTAYGDPKRETYSLFYSPKFSRKIIPRPSAKDVPFAGNATNYTYASNNQVIGKLSDVNKFNMGTGSDWTMTLFLKYNVPNATYSYPIFFAKRAAGFSGPGWNFFLEGAYWGFNSSIAGQAFGPNINDGNWHALTAVIRRSGDKDSVYVYTDGTNASARDASQQSANGNNLDNNTPLTIGYSPGNGNTDCNISICNVQIYNRAFTAEDVKRYGGVTHIDTSFPFWNNLEGYWPGYSDVNTTKLTERTGKAGDFMLKGPVNWMSFNETVAFFQPPIEESFYRLVPNAVDLPFMVYQWLGVSIKSDWGLDGKSWSPNYAQIRK